MEREKLLEEYKVTLESLVEKTKFVYSEDFYKLDEFEKQKYTKDKMTTEAHLSTLCELLWGNKVQVDSGLSSFWGLTLLSTMFNGGGLGTMPSSTNYLKKTLEEDEKKDEQEYAVPEN